MRKLLAWASSADDWLNPVAVREFRQAVQSRWVIAILVLFLLINLSVVGCYVVLSPDADTSTTGGCTIFIGLLSVLAITCIGFVPLYSGIRLSLERSDANVDLLFISTLTPGQIVRGKYLAAMALTLLIFSACMPFLTITYLLRGIDLPTIFFILAYTFGLCAAANALGILAGACSGSWLLRGLVDVGVLFCLFYMTAGAIAFANLITMGVASFGRNLDGYGIAFLLEIVGIGLCYVFAVALLSPKPSNRMLVPRLYITGCWAILGGVLAFWSYAQSSFGPIIAWAFVSGITFTILTVTSLGERDAWTIRVRRTIPRNRLLQAIAFLFYTGSAGGIIWATLMFALTMSVVSFISPIAGKGGYFGGAAFLHECDDLPTIFLYVLCYSLTVAFFRSILLRNLSTQTLPVFAAFLGVVLALGPYLAAFFGSRQWEQQMLPWYLLGSPLVLSTNNTVAKNAAGPFVVGWLVLCIFISAPWAFAQWRRFMPHRATVSVIPPQSA
jgi:hypothetical protein